MQAMAAELGVSRATVYRWAGNHDRLLAEVLVDLTRTTWALAEADLEERGVARVLTVYRRVLTMLVTSEPYRTALQRDPRQLLRVATRDSRVIRTVTELTERLLQGEVDRGELALSTDVRAVAAAMVRIGEATIYADLLAGVEPDVDRSVAIVELLLDPDRP
ncbi:MAG TPA: QsdR family transcriptional regulator [Acidimicrobiales bacterium]